MEKKYCPKCEKWLPKTNEYFYHYYNPLRNGRRTNGVWIHTNCRSCNRKIVLERNNRNYVKKLLQLSPKEILAQRDEQNKTPTRVCKKCKTEMELNNINFYWQPRLKRFESQCIYCRQEASRKVCSIKLHGEDLTNEMPGQFDCEEDRLAVAEILTKCGWKYSKEKEIWHKPGIKSMHNHWFFQKYKRNRNK